jgi:histidinol-phosphate aminotransferase
MNAIHGGDIYRNNVTMDFSVNVNPLGIPDDVKKVLHTAVDISNQYPDLYAEKLNNAVSQMLNIPKEYLIFGNGASELFMAIVHEIRPQKTVIPIPSFYGYEYAANAIDSEIIYYNTKEEDNFELKENFLSVLTYDVDIVFIANPNNPTGNLISKDFLIKIVKHCNEKNIYVVLDECFIDFCGEEYSLIKEITKYPNLLLVRAFTKIFAIPGVRLGYLVSSNYNLTQKIKRHLPEWNISVFAQAAGCECAKQTSFVENTVLYIRQEREYMAEKLKELLKGHEIKVYPSSANFILIYSEIPLYDKLLEKGILIRDCSNFRGLSKGFYRIAVKNREENETLIAVVLNGVCNQKIK